MCGESEEPLFTLMPNDLEGIKRIGHGKFGKVLKTEHEGQPIALKVLNEEKEAFDGRRPFDNEYKTLRRVDNHSNVVKILGYVDIGKHSFGIAMELCDGNLAKILRENRGSDAFPLQNALEVMTQICEGLVHLHEKNIIHRDLNPNNILFKSKCQNKAASVDVNENRFKIGDFGFARYLKKLESQTLSVLGTPGYIAPEILDTSKWKKKDNGKNHGTRYNLKVDIYSFGKIGMEVLECTTNSLDQDREIHKKCEALFEKCCEEKPDDRPTSNEIYQELKVLKTDLQEYPQNR